MLLDIKKSGWGTENVNKKKKQDIGKLLNEQIYEEESNWERKGIYYVKFNSGRLIWYRKRKGCIKAVGWITIN